MPFWSVCISPPITQSHYTMRSNFKLGRVLGIEVSVHPTWFIAFGFIAWTLGGSFFPGTFDGWTTPQYWLAGILTSLTLFASVLVHELAHSVIARTLGMRVEGIVLFIFGGVSQISGKYTRARNEFLVAFAGPASSLVLGGLLLVLWTTSRPDALQDTRPLMGIVFYIGMMNVLLGIFNLLPGFPLDGGRVLRSMVWGATGNERTAMRVAGTVGRLVAWGLIGFGAWRFLSGDIVGGLWTAFIGLFLSSASRSEQQAESTGEQAGFVPLRVAVQRTPEIVDASTSVSDVMDRLINRGYQLVAPVTDHGEPVGYFTPDDVRRFPHYEWPNLSVGSVIRREKIHAVQLSENAVSVLGRMRTMQVRHALVLAGDNVVGVIDQDGLEAAIRSMTSSGGASADRPQA